MACPTVSISAIALVRIADRLGCSAMSFIVAPVLTLNGLNAAFPTSFAQSAARISVDTGVSNPALANKPATAVA